MGHPCHIITSRHRSEKPAVTERLANLGIALGREPSHIWFT